MQNKNKSDRKTPDRQSIWETFLSAKEQMLYEFELAKKYSNSHAVKIFHGKVAEGIFRKWLSGFLPKRFEVTSGYIVPPNTLQYSIDKLSHFDVIVYDSFSSPVLWIENNPDNSSQGRSKAIPLQYVYAVIEVKSQMTPTTVKKAMKKLEELKPLFNKVNEFPDFFGEIFLPPNFYAGIVFFELKKKYHLKQNMLDDLLPNQFLRGYIQAFGTGINSPESDWTDSSYCGLVLRGEDIHTNNSGLISIIGNSKKPLCPKNVSLLEEKEVVISQKTVKYSHVYPDKLDFFVELNWNKDSFSEFAFHLVNRMNGIVIQGGPQSPYGTSNFLLDWVNPSFERHIQNP